jgi:hypothetical protein
MPDPLSPKSKYFITIDVVIIIIIIIIIILAALMNQPGTTGPTSTSTSTNYNLNKEKKRKGISKRQKGIRFMTGIYRSCGYYHTRTDLAPRYRTRRDNACTDGARTRSRGKSGCGLFLRTAPRRLSAQARHPSAISFDTYNPNSFSSDFEQGGVMKGTTLPRSKSHRDHRDNQRTPSRPRRAKSPNRQFQSCSKLFFLTVPVISGTHSFDLIREEGRTVAEVVVVTAVVG